MCKACANEAFETISHFILSVRVLRLILRTKFGFAAMWNRVSAERVFVGYIFDISATSQGVHGTCEFPRTLQTESAEEEEEGRSSSQAETRQTISATVYLRLCSCL